MFFVLRTHGNTESHWGYSAIGAFKTKKEAKAHAEKVLKETPSNDKLVVVKTVSLFKLDTWEIKEKEL